MIMVRQSMRIQYLPAFGTNHLESYLTFHSLVQCANTAFNPDPSLVSFSCRISSSLRELPDDQRRELFRDGIHQLISL